MFIGAVTFTGSIVAILQALGADQVRAADAARQELLNLGALVASSCSRCGSSSSPALWLLIAVTVVALAARLASRRLDRRRRHARRGLDAQQLLRLGRGGVGLPARQRPADHHRRARRLVRCVPVLHHVQGDEPLLHLRHRGWLRHRGAPAGDKDYGEHREITAEGVAELLAEADRRHHPRLRHGRGAGPVRVAELTRQLARAGRRRAVRHPSRGRPPARPHERAAGRGQGALRHRPGDGRDQRRLRRDRRRSRHRRERHREPRRHGGPEQPDRRHARAHSLGGRRRHRLQAVHGRRLRRRPQPAVLPGELPMLFGDAKDRVEDILRAL